MINKEQQYRLELFELLKNDLRTISNDDKMLSLIKEVFLTDVDELNSEDIIKKLIKS